MSSADLEQVTLRSPGREVLRQFAIHAENKVGRLHEIIGWLNRGDVHVMALATLDTTDSTIIRIVANYPDETRDILNQHDLSFTERNIVAVELDGEGDLMKVTLALIQAEINIHYIYPFLARPNGKSALAMGVEDVEVAIETLQSHQLRVLTQDDVAR